MKPISAENARRENSDTPVHGIGPATSPKEYHYSPLLVSVRDCREARLVAPFAFEVLDFKEPSRGPLAACDPRIWHEYAAIWCDNQKNPSEVSTDSRKSGTPSSLPNLETHRRLSVALGESAQAINLVGDVPEVFHYAKAGPSALPDTKSIWLLWDRLRKTLPQRTELVAVAYADWRDAATLPVEKILQAAVEAKMRTLLIDTFGKEKGGTLKLVPPSRLSELIQLAKDAGCEIVLAGGITFADAAVLISLGARRIGLRGALCRGPRNGEIDPTEVDRWTKLLMPRVNPNALQPASN